MLPRQMLRGAVLCRPLTAVSRSLPKCTPPAATLARTRFYSGASAENASANGNGSNGKEAAKDAAKDATKDAKPAEESQEKIIEKLKSDLDDAKHEILIARADRENSIRIAREDVRKAKEYGVQKFATALLDVNDILERALSAVTKEKLDQNADLKNFYEGVKMTERLMLKVYEQNDIKQFTPVGEKFDPNKHQALQEMADPTKEPGTVCFVMKSGYQLKDRLLRPASVVVVKDRPKQEPQTQETKAEPAAAS